MEPWMGVVAFLLVHPELTFELLVLWVVLSFVLGVFLAVITILWAGR